MNWERVQVGERLAEIVHAWQSIDAVVIQMEQHGMNEPEVVTLCGEAQDRLAKAMRVLTERLDKEPA